MRIYLQAFTDYECKLCWNKQTHHVRPTPKLCRNCAIEEWIRHGLINEDYINPKEKYDLFFKKIEEMWFEFYDYKEDVENLIKEITK